MGTEHLNDQQFVRMEKFYKLEKELARLGMEVAGLRKENAELKEEMARKVGKFERQITTLNDQNKLLAWQIKNSIGNAGNEGQSEALQPSSSNNFSLEMAESAEDSNLTAIDNNGVIGILAVKLESQTANGPNEQQNQHSNGENGQNGVNYPIPMGSSKRAKKAAFADDFGGAGSSQQNWAWEQIEANGEMTEEDLANLVEGIESKRTQNAQQEMEVSNNVGQKPQRADKVYKKLRKCQWPGCRFRSRFSSKIVGHKSTHTSEKASFICQKCGQNFSSFGNLKMHEIIHTGERPFACPECGLAFTQLGNMRRHAQKVHKK